MGPTPAVAAIRHAVRGSLAEIAADQLVLVACSGGADSLALAAALAFERPGRAGLITVDHALQPGSAAQATAVARCGSELGLAPVLTATVSVGTAGGLEAAARTARYAALGAAAVEHDAVILLGHTLDDQAETVLLGLGRGSGPRSVAGMRPVQGAYRRPLLALRREQTRQCCRDLGLPVWDDPHNDDPRFQRVRLRREVLPLLEDVLQSGVAQALARTAELLRTDLDTLDALAQALPRPSELDVIELAAHPAALRTRVILAWLRDHGAEPVSVHVHAVDALVTGWHGQGPVDIPGGSVVARVSGKLCMSTRDQCERSRDDHSQDDSA